MKQFISYIILLMAPAFVAAQSKLPVLTLDSVISRIDKQNELLQSYALQAEAYRYSADAATAWMAPMVGVGTFMTPYPGQKVMEARDRGNIMLQVEQDIPNPAKLNARKKYIQSQGNIVAAGRDITLNELRLNAKRFYYSWQIASNRIRILRENEKLMNTMKKIEEVRYPYNQSQLSGIYLVTARLEENNNMIRMQEGIIARAQNALLGMMNAPITDSFQIDTITERHFVPAEIYDTAVIASARKDVVRMNESIRSMQLNIESMRKERKPDFRIRFDHMNPLTGMMPKAYNIMGMISIPIVPWSSKMYKSEIKAMEYNIRGMEKERVGMIQETRGMLLGMQKDIESMHERVLSIENKIIPALQKALDANYILYQENKLALPAIIDSWEALNMMKMTLLDEKLKHLEMIAEYEKELFK